MAAHPSVIPGAAADTLDAYDLTGSVGQVLAISAVGEGFVTLSAADAGGGIAAGETVTAPGVASPALGVQAAAGQTAPIFPVYASDGTTLKARVTATGDWSHSHGKANAEAYGSGSAAGAPADTVVGQGATTTYLSGSAFDGANVVVGQGATCNHPGPGGYLFDCVVIGRGAAQTGAGNTKENVLIGAQAAATGGTGVVVVGANASVTSGGVAVGGSATAAASGTAVGSSASAVNGGFAVAVGSSASATGRAAVAIGYLASAGHRPSVAVGWQAATTAANQIVFGSAASFDGLLNNLYIGRGVSVAAPPAEASYRTTSASSGSGAAGTDLVLRPGAGDGAGRNGLVKIHAATFPTTDPLVAGALWNDAGTLKVSAG